jgi:hypothetical protein
MHDHSGAKGAKTRQVIWFNPCKSIVCMLSDSTGNRQHTPNWRMFLRCRLLKSFLDQGNRYRALQAGYVGVERLLHRKFIVSILLRYAAP